MTELKLYRDNNGFLKCQNCPRRFLTKIGLQNHSTNEHKNDEETQLDKLLMNTNKKDQSASQNKKLCFRPVL